MTVFSGEKWRISQHKWSDSTQIVDNSDKLICEMYNDKNLTKSNLIAAAPELYDALEILTDTISSITGENTVEKYRKLLAKARGEV